MAWKAGREAVVAFKYDGSDRDYDHAVEEFYQFGARDLAEDVYEARRLARRLVSILVADEYYTERDIARWLGLDEDTLPYWAMDREE